MAITQRSGGGFSILAILTLVVVVIAFLAIRNLGASQPLNTGQGAVTVTEAEYEALAEEALGTVYFTKAHASRHKKTVADISDKCNEGTAFIAKAHNPNTGRDAFVCFIEGFWVVTVKNFSPEQIEKWGDDIVTAFPRRMAKDLQDVIEYLLQEGYQVIP
jgi:hypothetical protein